MNWSSAKIYLDSSKVYDWLLYLTDKCIQFEITQKYCIRNITKVSVLKCGYYHAIKICI